MPLPRGVNHLLGCGLVAPGLVMGLNVRATAMFRWTLLIAVLMQCVAICGFVYVSWCPVGQEWISGLQGRYFLPLAAFRKPTRAAASIQRKAGGPSARRV